MNKNILLLAMVLLALYNNPSAKAQEVRLDSLWVKYGGVFAMSFSPDSKTLAIGEDGDEGQIRIFEAQTGREIDSIAHSDFVDMQFTPNGKQLMVIDHTSIKFYNSTTYKLERTIPYDNGGKIVFSPIESIICLVGGATMRIYDLAKEEVLAYLSRPDKYSTGPNKTEYYLNGKVTFSADGKYIIGKYENSLVRWDWQNAPTKPEIMIGEIPNLAIIGFSPDKKYFVLQSNYLWDTQQGKQVAVEGLTGYNSETAYGFAATVGGSCIAVTEPNNHTPQFLNMVTKKVFSTSMLKYAVLMSISPDSSYFAYQYGSGQVHLHKVAWNSTGIIEENDSNVPLTLIINPQPSNSTMKIEIKNTIAIPFCRLDIIDNVGSFVSGLYQGELSKGATQFYLNSTLYPSGKYYLRLSYESKEVIQGFIITK